MGDIDRVEVKFINLLSVAKVPNSSVDNTTDAFESVKLYLFTELFPDDFDSIKYSELIFKSVTDFNISVV